jgi:hypothetical protein
MSLGLPPGGGRGQLPKGRAKVANDAARHRPVAATARSMAPEAATGTRTTADLARAALT